MLDDTPTVFGSMETVTSPSGEMSSAGASGVRATEWTPEPTAIDGLSPPVAMTTTTAITAITATTTTAADAIKTPVRLAGTGWLRTCLSSIGPALLMVMRSVPGAWKLLGGR